MLKMIRCGNCLEFTEYDDVETDCEHCGMTNIIQNDNQIFISNDTLEVLIDTFLVSTEIMDMDDDDLVDEVAPLFYIHPFSSGESILMKNTFLHSLTDEEKYSLQAAYMLAHTTRMIEE